MSHPSAEQARRALQYLDTLLECSDAERQRALQQLDDEQPELAAEVRRLLRFDQQASGLLDHDLRDVAATVVEDLEATPQRGEAKLGQTIGQFELLRPLGRGGMGEVWLARRSAGGIEQQLAVKLLRSGMDSEDILARFMQERRILAGLDHPGIARFIEGGVSDDGRPWYAMEHVDGVPINRYASEHQLDVRQRVSLLLAVCEAVAYAQQRLVVHRDLKPGNVLVDADGRVRLLDFGIAKILEDGIDAHATATGLRAMSPAYAAPEQILGETISTATDVYALGAVLFELLTGSLPHARDGGSLPALARQISEETSERPSTALRRRHDTGTDSTLCAPQYRRGLNRDLDLIVLRALRVEPERRYQTAAALAEDLQRWLDGHPVRAAGDSTRYRVGKFLQRHRGPAIAAALVLVSLLGGLTAALWQAQRATAEAARAELQTQRAEAQTQEALAQTRRAERTRDFLVSVFQQENFLTRDARGDISLAEAFDDAVRRAADELADDSRLLAELYRSFAMVRAGQRQYPQALELLDSSLAAMGEPGPETDLLRATVLLDKVSALFAQGRQPDGLPLLEQALPVLEQHADSAPGTLLYALNARMGAAEFLGDIEGQHRYSQRALELARGAYPPDAPQLGEQSYYHAGALLSLGYLDQAEVLYEESLRIVRLHQGDEAPPVLMLLRALSEISALRGDQQRSEALLEQRQQLTRRILPDDHHWHAALLTDLGLLREQQGRLDEAEALLRESLQMYQRLGHLRQHVAAASLAGLFRRSGRLDAARSEIELAAQYCSDPAYSPSRACLIVRSEEIEILAGLGLAESAISLAEPLVQDITEKPPGPWLTEVALSARASAYRTSGRSADERRDREALVSLLSAHLPAHGPKLLAARQNCPDCP